MIALGETELICDFAETYGITDMWALPVPTMAALASGLKDDSRIRMKLSNQKIDLHTWLLASAVDYLALIGWIVSGAASNKKERPKRIVEMLMGESAQKKKDSGLRTYATPDDFNKAWAEVTGNG